MVAHDDRTHSAIAALQLALNNNNIGDAGAVDIAKMLSGNRTLAGVCSAVRGWRMLCRVAGAFGMACWRYQMTASLPN